MTPCSSATSERARRRARDSVERAPARRSATTGARGSCDRPRPVERIALDAAPSDGHEPEPGQPRQHVGRDAASASSLSRGHPARRAAGRAPLLPFPSVSSHVCAQSLRGERGDADGARRVAVPFSGRVSSTSPSRCERARARRARPRLAREGPRLDAACRRCSASSTSPPHAALRQHARHRPASVIGACRSLSIHARGGIAARSSRRRRRRSTRPSSGQRRRRRAAETARCRGRR